MCCHEIDYNYILMDRDYAVPACTFAGLLRANEIIGSLDETDFEISMLSLRTLIGLQLDII